MLARIICPQQREAIQAILRDAELIATARQYLMDVPPGEEPPAETVEELRQAKLRVKRHCWGRA